MRGLVWTTCIALSACSPSEGGEEENAVAVERGTPIPDSESPSAEVLVADYEQLAPSGDAEIASLTLEVTSWGRPVDRISISAEGNVRHEIWERPFTNAPKSEVNFTLSKAQHQKVMNVLAILRSRSGGWINCDNMPTDGPYASIIWNGADRLDIYQPCLSNPKFARSRAAIDEFREYIAGLEPPS